MTRLFLTTTDILDWNQENHPLDADMNEAYRLLHLTDVAYIDLRDSGLQDRDPVRYNDEIERIQRLRHRADEAREIAEADWGPLHWGEVFDFTPAPAPAPAPTQDERDHLDGLWNAYLAELNATPADPFDVFFAPLDDADLDRLAPLYDAYRAELARLGDLYPNADLA